MKDLLSNLNIYKGETSKQYLSKSIIAETKQAMSSILQVGGNYEYEYLNPSFSKSQISEYLLSLNWNNPWDSGAQFANTAFLSPHQMKKPKIKDFIYMIIYLLLPQM